MQCVGFVTGCWLPIIRSLAMPMMRVAIAIEDKDMNVAQMTKMEFKELLETVIEQKLLELIGDPDAGLVIKQSLYARLLYQQQVVVNGERGKVFDDVVQQLDLG